MQTFDKPIVLPSIVGWRVVRVREADAVLALVDENGTDTETYLLPLTPGKDSETEVGPKNNRRTIRLAAADTSKLASDREKVLEKIAAEVEKAAAAQARINEAPTP